MSFEDETLRDILLDPKGVHHSESNEVYLKLCSPCLSSLRSGKVPPLSLANHNFLGAVPDELKDLTVVEEAMIAHCRVKCWIIQLKEDNQDLTLPHAQ